MSDGLKMKEANPADSSSSNICLGFSTRKPAAGGGEFVVLIKMLLLLMQKLGGRREGEATSNYERWTVCLGGEMRHGRDSPLAVRSRETLQALETAGSGRVQRAQRRAPCETRREKKIISTGGAVFRGPEGAGQPVLPWSRGGVAGCGDVARCQFIYTLYARWPWAKCGRRHFAGHDSHSCESIHGRVFSCAASTSRVSLHTCIAYM